MRFARLLADADPAVAAFWVCAAAGLLVILIGSLLNPRRPQP